MPRSDTQAPRVHCHSHVVATGVMRVRITGRVETADASAIEQTVRDAQARADITLLDVRAAPITDALRQLIETADTRARMRRRRLVILEQAPVETDSELVTMGLTATVMTIEEPPDRDNVGLPGRSDARAIRA